MRAAEQEETHLSVMLNDDAYRHMSHQTSQKKSVHMYNIPINDYITVHVYIIVHSRAKVYRSIYVPTILDSAIGSL